MAVNVIKRTWLQDRMVRPETLNGMVFQEEAGAHRFEITGYDSNGNVMAFSGTVTAIFLRPDNTDVPLTGVISNGVAQVTLSKECYQVPGRFGLAIFVNSGNTKTVVYKCIGPVGMTSSGVAASSVVQSVSTLIDRIDAAVNSIPQDFSALNKAVSATCPEMRNGSTGNPGNANSITTKYIIKIDKTCDELILEYIGNTQAKYYIFGYSVFKGVADGTESIVARTTAASFLDYPEKYEQTEPYVIIPVSQFGDYTHIAFVLWAKSDETTNIPLRIATDQNNLRVTFRHASYMGHEEINNRSVKVGVQNASKMASPLKLVHFSDLHRDVNALNRIRASIKYVCPNADNVICTGDIVADTYAEITSWWVPEFMTCIGNHDTALYNGAYDWTALTMAQRDEMYISPFKSYWGIVHTAGTSYYYKDYPTAHIRLIVMDAMLYSGTPGAEATTQTEWLANLLASAITGGLHVIIAIHAPHGGSVPVACSFTKLGQGNMYVNVDCNTPDVVINTVATAIGNGLHFIGYICGHTHQDAIWDCTGDRSQLMYNVTCAAVDQTAQWIDSDQYRTDEQDAFNVLTIDTASTTIKILRGGGANTDVALRPRVSMVINYSTGKIITDTYASGTQDAVVYGEAQELTDAQKAQARANIGAGSAADVSENTADITANAEEITSLKSALTANRSGTLVINPMAYYRYTQDVETTVDFSTMPLNTYVYAQFSVVKSALINANFPLSWSDTDFVHMVRLAAALNSGAVKDVSIIRVFNFRNTQSAEMLYFATSSGNKYRWVLPTTDFTKEHLPADAKAVGDALAGKQDVSTLINGRNDVVLNPWGTVEQSSVGGDAIDFRTFPMNTSCYTTYQCVKQGLSDTNMPETDWADNDFVVICRTQISYFSNLENSIITLYNFSKTRKLEMIYFANSQKSQYRWLKSNSEIVNYNTFENTIHQYSNSYNVSASPSITIDTNNYLQPTGDQTDMSAAIVTMLTQTGVCNLAPGDFYVSGIEMPYNSVIRGCGASTNIILLSSVANGFAIKMGSRCIVDSVMVSGGTVVPTITSDIGTRDGILWQGTAIPGESTTSNTPIRGIISNCMIRNFSGSGIRCYGTGTGISNCLNVSNVYVYNSTVGVNIEWLSEFHRFTNVDCRGCYYGIINNGGNNTFANCGFSKNIIGLLMDNTNGQSNNNSHGSFSNCVFNHSGNNNDGTAIHIIGCANGEMFVGCQIFYGETIIENSSGIVFSACNYKGSTGSPISINGGGLVKLVDCVFGSTASITITNNTATVVDGCYLRNGTAVVLN